MKIDNNKIEILLNEIYNSDYYVMPFADEFNSNFDYKLYVNIIEVMIEELGLINNFQTKKSTLYVTKFGRNIILNFGGWLKYLEYEKHKTKQVEKKSFFDFEVSKFKYYTFWWFFGISIIGSGLSLYNFINTPSEIKQQELRIDKMEKKLKVLPTSSILTKKNLYQQHKLNTLTKKTQNK